MDYLKDSLGALLPNLSDETLIVLKDLNDELLGLASSIGFKLANPEL